MTMNFPHSEARIMVVGDAMVDSYLEGDVLRISPEAPVPVVRVNKTQDRAGGAANVAMNIASLGASASLVSAVGEDDAGRILRAILDKAEIISFLTTTQQPTIKKLRVVSRQQQIVRADFEEEMPLLSPLAQSEAVLTGLAKSQLLILSDYGKGTLQDPQAWIHTAKRLGIPVFIDPKGNDFTRYRQATLIKPNLREFEQIVGPCKSQFVLESKGMQLLESLSIEMLLITQGADGMTLLQKNDSPKHVAAHASDVFDVSGAGDTVIAAFGSAYASGCDPFSAMLMANAAAAIAVRHFGTSIVTQAELKRAMCTKLGGILEEDALLQQVAVAKKLGERIIMTNGCFDILHAGHVQYLQQAKALGDRLIVAVNDDASVRKLKGPTRPLNPLQARMQVLEALAAVDWVVAFSEETPERLITQVLPDTLVKGGDYQRNEIAGAQAVLKNGGDVRLLPFLDGHSTSQLVRKIQAQTQGQKEMLGSSIQV